jgi:uncharacterized membrane protein
VRTVHDNPAPEAENLAVGASFGARRVESTITVALAVATALGIWLLRPTGAPDPAPEGLGSFRGTYTARIEERTERPCAGVAGANCVHLQLRLLEGPDEGTRISIELPRDNARTEAMLVGQRVVLGHQPDVEGFEYVVLDPDRRSALYLLAGVFVVAVVALGRWRGVRALFGLVATVALLFLFVVPAVLDGRDPLVVSLVGASAIAYAALYTSHGFETRTTIALLGTLGGLACAAIAATVFMQLAVITGAASEEALYVTALGIDVDLRGLILGGMMIGALGAIDDMTVTQATAVQELRTADPGMPRGRLLRASMRIGRDHVASTVNTLLLAYAGASMPLLILFVLSGQPASTVASTELVATEIVRTLVGSLGLVASVPITTWLAAGRTTRTGRHARKEPQPIHIPDRDGPEEHPIPEHRRDVWAAWLRAQRERRFRA